MQNFEVASGTIVGRDHSDPLRAKANQDAYHVAVSDNSIVALVCDGCSSGTHSEVGAKIGARLISQAITTKLALIPEEPTLTDIAAPFMERVRQETLYQIRVLADAMGGSFSRTIADYFLFTALGVVITKKWSFRFSIGDGIFFINDEMNQLGPFDGNEPPYLVYPLVQTGFSEHQLRFQYRLLPPTDELNSVLVGSDGVVDLAKFGGNALPGKAELLGPINQFWQEERYFRNPDNVRRRLALTNKPSIRIDSDGKLIGQEHGLLPDDTTLVVIRRTNQVMED